MKNLIAVIPALDPDRTLVSLVEDLRRDFRGVFVVDDGSGPSAGGVFASLPRTDNVRLLSHGANRGKGAALKTAFAEVLRTFPDAVGALTVDADGQHLPEDVRRVGEALCARPDRIIIGVRTFDARTPFRSRLGNLWTLAEFRLLTGRSVRDTQTGLRGIPLRLLPMLMEIQDDRYGFEIRMLAKAVLALGGVTQVPIRTVYADGNRSSHFRPLADTLETQRALFSAAFTERFGSRPPA